MLTLPDVIVSILAPFATLFTNPTWQKAQLLLVGAVLATGQRTVPAALRVMGRGDQRDYARYHEVLNRAVWSPREAARILLLLLIHYLDRGDGPLIFGIDETLERRRGAKIRARGVYRDAVRSSRHQLVKASGLRWISLMWLGDIPWAGRHWALPVLTVLAPSSRYHQQQGRWHKKITDWARQMVMLLRRWLPHRPWCWWGITATPCWICSTAASPYASRLPSSPDCAWTPHSTRQHHRGRRAKLVGQL